MRDTWSSGLGCPPSVGRMIDDSAGSSVRQPGHERLPVSVVVSRRPAPGRERDLATWADGVSAAAAAFPGHLAARVYRPDPPDRDDLVIAFTFTDASSLSAWEVSDIRRSWLAAAEPLTQGGQQTHAVSGFESLFAPGVHATASPPPRWKTAVIIALALYPASLAVGWLITPRLPDLPLPGRVLVSTLVIVPYMVWIGVPWATRWMQRWLNPSAGREPTP